MSDHGEYLFALIATGLGVSLALVAIYGWRGFPGQPPKVTKGFKWLVRVAACVWGCLQAFIIYRNRGSKPWTNFTSQDFITAKSYFSLVMMISWRWLLFIGAVLAAFVVGRSSGRHAVTPAQRPEGHPSDQRLRTIATQDRESIKNLVRVVSIYYRPDFERAYIDFVFSVFNNSLYDVVIENSIESGGFILYGLPDHERFHYPPRITSDTPIFCGSRRGASFVVRQPIREEGSELQFKENKDTIIAFGNLTISFRAKDCPEIGSPHLDNNHYLETAKYAWTGDAPEIVFGLSDEQWAELKSGNAERLLEIKKLKSENLLLQSLAASQVSKPPEAPEVRCDDQQFCDITMKDGSLVKAGAFDRGRYRINKAAFVDFKLNYDEKAGKAIDLRAEVVFRDQNGQTFHARDGVWDQRQSRKVPLRHGETQSLILTAFDEDGIFYTYENQHPRGKPITVPLQGSALTAEVIITREYGETVLPPLRWYFLLSKTPEGKPEIKQTDAAGTQRKADAVVV